MSYSNIPQFIEFLDEVGDATITSKAQGDIIFVNGSDEWVNLSAGTDGQVLRTKGSGANPVWGAKNLEKIDKNTLTTAGTTLANFGGLDINADGMYVLIIEIENNTTNGLNLECFLNGDTTSTNYEAEVLIVNGGTVSATNQSKARIISAGGSDSATSISYIQRNATNGQITIETIGGRQYKQENTTTFTSGTKSNVTSIKLEASYELKVGSTAVLYKIER